MRKKIADLSDCADSADYFCFAKIEAYQKSQKHSELRWRSHQSAKSSSIV